MFVAWPEIVSFHNIRKYAHAHPEILNGESKVTYKCKIKLHGSNAAVRVLSDGSMSLGELPRSPTVIAQSRSQDLTVTNDNAGFAKWLESTKENKEAWIGGQGYIIFGEWIGPGVQKGVAASEIPKKSFVVFAATHSNPEHPDLFQSRPNILELLIKDVPGAYVLPWHDKEIEIDWAAPAKELQVKVDQINNWVAEVPFLYLRKLLVGKTILL